jgi:hypothetical protein
MESDAEQIHTLYIGVMGDRVEFVALSSERQRRQNKTGYLGCRKAEVTSLETSLARPTRVEHGGGEKQELSNLNARSITLGGKYIRLDL